MAGRPNIILVCADQQRMDSLACYGNRFISSPGTSAMAANGMVFDRAFTPWPVCTPARGTMWTGLYPHAHGLINNVYGVDNAFATHAKVKQTVFDHLRQAGYLTAHFGKWHLGEICPPFFDVWEECFNSRVGHWVDGKLDGTYRPDLATRRCIDFLESPRAAERPFVMVQSYYPPHDPYSAPQRFYEPYRGRGIPFAGYYAAVSALDHNLAAIRDALARTGLAGNTYLIYYSDHGDTFFYRPDGEHKFVCFDDAIRIPFIAEGPASPPAPARRRRSACRTSRRRCSTWPAAGARRPARKQPEAHPARRHAGGLARRLFRGEYHPCQQDRAAQPPHRALEADRLRQRPARTLRPRRRSRGGTGCVPHPARG